MVFVNGPFKVHDYPDLSLIDLKWGMSTFTPKTYFIPKRILSSSFPDDSSIGCSGHMGTTLREDVREVRYN